jgi:hypothetical protein
MIKKLLLLGVLGGVGWVAYDNRADLQRYLRIRAM